MATMVASGSSQLSSPLPVQGQRNKRKFRTEPQIVDSNKNIPAQMEYPNFDFSTEIKSADDLNIQQHAGVCDFCTTALGCPPLDELDLEDYPDADWTETTEAQLEELVLKNLHMIFKGAILKVVSCGYDEEVATKAVLRSGICYGCKDTLSNIIDNALALLAKGKDVSSLVENFCGDLQQLEKCILDEMVGVLREVRPFFSKGDAMWYLLVCDMNVSHACSMDDGPLSGSCSDERTWTSSISQAKHEASIYASASTNYLKPIPKTKQSHSMQQSLQFPPQIQMPPVAGIPNLPSVRSTSSSSMYAIQSNSNQCKENSLSASDSLVEEISCSMVAQTCAPEKKSMQCKKGHGVGPKRELIIPQKPLEKNFRTYKSKGAPRTGKMSNLGSLIFDKRCKASPEASAVHLKSVTMKKNKSVGGEPLLEEDNPSLSFNAGVPTNMPFSSKNVNTTPYLPTENTELSLSIPSKSESINRINSSSPKPNTDILDYRNYPGVQSDMINGQWVPQDKKDEMMLNLVNRARELQAQMQEWSEWAQQKVMQAARRLSKEKAELQSLRHEKDEASRLRKEKQTVEENTIKKLTEMESALSKASTQVEKANIASRNLGAENARLRLEMEAAMLRAAESAASCREVSKREMETMKNAQTWEREKMLLREELVDKKKKFVLLQQQVEQAKSHLSQLEGRVKQEEKVKEEVLKQLNSLRWQREQIESSAKLKEDSILSEAERNLQRYKDDIRKLESQVTKLRINAGLSKVATPTWTPDSLSAHRSRDIKVSFPSSMHCINGMVMDPHEAGYNDVARDRECVMCLTEEMSVVFLPCAHQVVCNTCNDIHEKQGMKDCPSCRTPIKRRISLRPLISKP